MTNPHDQALQKKILNLYAAFGAALLLSFVPFLSAMLISLLLFVGVLIAAYVMRSGAKDGDLMENHMTFVICTMWIGGLFALISITAGSIYLFYAIDVTPLIPCMDNLLQANPDIHSIDLQVMLEVYKGCFGDYFRANTKVFIIASIIGVGPILVYFVVRFARGLSRAIGGYRIANAKSWF